MLRGLNSRLANRNLLIVTGLLVMGIMEALVLAPDAPNWEQVPLTFVWTVPLIWRRRWPVPVLAVVIVMGPTLGLVNEEGGVMSFVLSAILAAYTVGRELDPPSTWWGPALTAGFGWVVSAATNGKLSDYVFLALLYGGAWAVGYAIRRRDLQVGELTKETAELRRTQEEVRLKAVEEERSRIARELHDIVSHSISVITIQAQVLRRRLGPSCGEVDEALRSIETTSRQAMTEMRRLLTVLRAGDSGLALAPQPSLEQLADLFEEARTSGLEVALTVEGRPVPVPAGLALTAYRVVQEALTNVRKHSGALSARVVLRYGEDRLEIEVEDSGPGRGQTGDDHRWMAGGLGLSGMRERVKLYGGKLDAAPLAEGGFRLNVVLPLRESELSSI